MENQKSHNNIFGFIALILISAALAGIGIYLCFSSRDRTPVSLADMGDPSQIADKYFDSLINAEYDECDKYLWDFSIKEMEKEPESELGKLMHTALVKSYDYELPEECTITGKDAKISVKVSYLDLSLLGDAMKIAANEIAEDLNYHGEDIFSEESAKSIALKAFEQVEASASDFCVDKEISIALIYNGEEWKIIYNESLEEMLMGKG